MQTITCKAAIAWEAEKPLEVVDIDVAPPQVTAPLLLSSCKPSVLSILTPPSPLPSSRYRVMAGDTYTSPCLPPREATRSDSMFISC